MRPTTAGFAIVLLACLAAPVQAQGAKSGARDPARERERAIQRCQENRGADCKSEAGLKEWLDEEKPMTEQQRRSAAAARLHRENCAKSKKAPGC